MPSILLDTLESDLQTIVDHLNEDPDIAYVIPDGPRRWRTINQFRKSPPDNTRCGIGRAALCHWSDRLWKNRIHRSSIPMTVGKNGCRLRSRDNPSSGRIPWLSGSTCLPGGPGSCPCAPCGWIGNRCRAIGHGATPAANGWWRTLQRWIRNRTTTVHRGGLEASGPADVAAFPAALTQLQQGVPGELNPPAP